mmetsp:Transcript_19820/g.55286  ORF Transcript_19820/g.55286 Transcript_19820/m.55286 type:complete len:314 (-) Transcript_19820:366-1307(-)
MRSGGSVSDFHHGRQLPSSSCQIGDRGLGPAGTAFKLCQQELHQCQLGTQGRGGGPLGGRHGRPHNVGHLNSACCRLHFLGLCGACLRHNLIHLTRQITLRLCHLSLRVLLLWHQQRALLWLNQLLQRSEQRRGSGRCVLAAEAKAARAAGTAAHRPQVLQSGGCRCQVQALADGSLQARELGGAVGIQHCPDGLASLVHSLGQQRQLGSRRLHFQRLLSQKGHWLRDLPQPTLGQLAALGLDLGSQGIQPHGVHSHQHFRLLPLLQLRPLRAPLPHSLYMLELTRQHCHAQQVFHQPNACICTQPLPPRRYM